MGQGQQRRKQQGGKNELTGSTRVVWSSEQWAEGWMRIVDWGDKREERAVLYTLLEGLWLFDVTALHSHSEHSTAQAQHAQVQECQRIGLDKLEIPADISMHLCVQQWKNNGKNNA